MRIVATLKLKNVSQDQIEPGQLDVSDDTKMPFAILRVKGKIHNAGVADAAMTAAEKEALLAQLVFDWKYGSKLDMQPYAQETFERMRTEARFYMGVELDGWIDDTVGSGLDQVVPDGTSAAFTLDCLLPTGRRWWLGPQHQDDGAMGKLQARTAKLFVKRLLADGTAFSGNWSFDGDVSIDVIPVEVPSHGDPFSVLPEFREIDETNNETKNNLADGITDALTEGTNPNATTSLTNLLVKVGDLVLVDTLGPADIIVPYLATPNLPADASIADKETFLVMPIPYVTRKEDLPAGIPYVRKNIPAELATMVLFHRYTPIVAYEKMRAELDHLASLVDKPVKFVKAHVLDKRALKNKAHALLEAQVGFTADDREFSALPGYAAHKDGGEISVPKSIVAQAQQTYSERKAHGEEHAAEDVVHSLAASIPGAVTNGAGFGVGSSTVHARVKGWFR